MISEEIQKRGYIYFNDAVTGAEALFIKKVRPNYFLSLGFTISNFYDSRFTATFYLSKTTLWGAIWGDIPRNSYIRVGQLLNEYERTILLDTEFNQEGVVDAWWLTTDQEIKNFLKALDLAELRLLADRNLFNEIEKSSEVNKLAEYSALVISMVPNIKRGDSTLKNYFQQCLEKVPAEWINVAEQVIRLKGGILNKNTVSRLASDAWRQNFLSQ